VSAGFVDVAIVGGGPAGLASSYYSGMFGLSFCMFEALGMVGGQCSSFYPDKMVYGVPGVTGLRGMEFADSLLHQSLSDIGSFKLGSQVARIVRTDLGFDLFSESSEFLVSSKFLVLARGVGNMTPIVPSEIDMSCIEEKDFVQYSCISSSLYKDKTVVIAGGGDSAIDFANHISRVAKKVFIVHRGNSLKQSTISLHADQDKLFVMLNKKIVSIKADVSGRHVVVNDNVTGVISVLRPDYIVFCYGFSVNAKGISGLDLELCNGLINVDIESMETSVRGCYAAGDCVWYANKKKNLISCFYEADMAIRSISRLASV
jgi:thioredoxin reductase (NADPH)